MVTAMDGPTPAARAPHADPRIGHTGAKDEPANAPTRARTHTSKIPAIKTPNISAGHPSDLITARKSSLPYPPATRDPGIRG